MNRTLAFTLISSLLALTGCDQVTRVDDGDDTGSGSAVPGPVQERLTQSCAISGCHVAGLTPPDLSADGGGAWVSQSGAGGPYVTFGDVGNSYLIEKMFPGPSAGSQMPIAPGEITPEDLAVIVGWVAGVEFPDGGDTDDPTGDTNDTADTEDPTAASGDTDSETGADVVSCALSVIDSSVANPIVSGDEAGVIPTFIGEALERNCGCHYVTEADPPYIPFSAGTQLQTLENFTNDYAGGNTMYDGMPAWMAVQDRVVTQMTMPTIGVCVTDEGTSLTERDLGLFHAWFEQGAPDGATFEPPGGW